MKNIGSAEMVSIGTEILFGEITDTNAPFLASELKDLGVQVLGITVVDDHRDRLKNALQLACSRSDLVIYWTGGLGPTDDDPTREAIAEYLGEKPEIDDNLLGQMTALFAARNRPMSPKNRKQAWLIPSARALANPLGTAPGWLVEKGKTLIVAMPGPPHEMKRMWHEEVLPKLNLAKSGFHQVTLHTFGIGESIVGERLGKLTRSENPYVGTYARPHGVDIRISARAENPGGAQALVSTFEPYIRKLFPDNLYGIDTDTLSSVVGKTLSGKQQSLATLESVTGGLILDRLTDTPGASGYVRGGAVVYTPDAKIAYGVPAELIARAGVVSEEVALAMATCARERFQADWGLASTGVAGPDAVDGLSPGLVWLAVAGPTGPGQNGLGQKGQWTQKLNWPAPRRLVKERSANASLMLLWQILHGKTVGV